MILTNTKERGINRLKKEIKPSDTLLFIFSAMAVITLLILIIGLFVSKEPLSFALGLLFGGAISVVRILMLARAVNISVDMEPADSKTYMVGQYNIRMMLTVAAVVVGAMTKGRLSILGIVLGLIAMQPSVYAANIIYKVMGGEKVESVSTKKTHRHS